MRFDRLTGAERQSRTVPSQVGLYRRIFGDVVGIVVVDKGMTGDRPERVQGNATQKQAGQSRALCWTRCRPGSVDALKEIHHTVRFDRPVSWSRVLDMRDILGRPTVSPKQIP